MTNSFDSMTAIAGKNVLIFRPYGIAINHFAIEQAVCGQLTQRGANVKWLVCNGIFIECDQHWQLLNRANKADACTRCVGSAQQVANRFDLNMDGLGAHLTSDDYTSVSKWVMGLDPSTLFDAKLNDWELGLWAKSSVNTQLRCADIMLDEPAHVQAYHAYLHGAALTAIALTRYLDTAKVDAIFMMNGRTAASRTVFEIARARSIPVAIHEFGRSEETRYLFMNEGCLSLGGWDQHWSVWKDKPLSGSEIQQVKSFMDARLKGTVDFAFNKHNTITSTQLIGDSRKCKIVSLFTSSTDEISANADWSWPFTQIDWLREVVRYFKARPEYMLVIRCHPNHDHTFYGRDYQFLNALATLDLAAVNNIKVVMPSEKVDSYSLMLASEASMVFSSTMGLEASLLGVKAMIAGCGRNQDRQVAREYKDGDLSHLPASLDAFLDAPADPQWRVNAARWLHLFAFRYVYEVPLVRRNGNQVACLPEAYTKRLADWPFLEHIVEFFTNGGQAFEPFPPRAIVDAHEYDDEAVAIREAFEGLAQREHAKGEILSIV
jgi:hypothetical protein